jgi:hypothetical protein
MKKTARLGRFGISGVGPGVKIGAALLLVCGLAAQAQGSESAVVRPTILAPGVALDWSRGVLTASASSAADLYAASAEVARVKAERLARLRAQDRLRLALKTLSHEPRLRGKLSPELLAKLDPAQAKLAHIEYAATGSVSLRLELPLTPPAPSSAATSPAPSAPADGGGEVQKGETGP